MKNAKLDMLLGELRELDHGAAVMSTAERMSYIPASGEMILDSEDAMLYIGDGLTVGGAPTVNIHSNLIYEIVP